MTPGVAWTLARRTLRAGYFRPAGRDPYVKCPECQVNVTRRVAVVTKAADVARGLCEALAAHLRDDCARSES